jgi:hypothetical protein
MAQGHIFWKLQKIMRQHDKAALSMPALMSLPTHQLAPIPSSALEFLLQTCFELGLQGGS